MKYFSSKISLYLTLTSLFLCSLNFTYSQQWVELMMSPKSNFYDIQKAFNKEWAQKSYVKGKGWKQYKRWENFWESRVLEDGTFPVNSKVWKGFKELTKKSLNKSGGIGNWQALGPFSYTSTDSWSPGSGRVNCIVEDPNNSNIIYIGAPAGGIWKTIDGGITWTPLGDEFSTIGVSGISIDPNNTNTIYLCTGDSDGGDTYSIGLLKSTDGGLTWNSIGNITSNKTTEIIIDPTNSSILYLATNNGLLKSNDSGNTWSTLLTGNIRDIDIKPGNSSTIFAVTSDTFHVSNDGGATWTNITNGLPGTSGRLAIATTPANSNYVYILSANTGNGFQGLYRSTNSGTSFNTMNSNTDIFESTQAWYDMAITVSNTDENTVITGVLNLWKSTNGGSSFTKLNSWSNPSSSAYTHADIHYLKYFGGNLYCGSDGGIYKSTNNGNSFNDLSFGLQIGQFYRIGGAENDVNTIAGGLQDNGGYALKNGNWKVYYGADGMEAGVDPNNSNIIFGMIQYGDLYRSTNGANTSSGLGSPQTGRWVTPMQMDQNNDRLVAGYDDLFEYDYNNGWNQLSTFTFPQQIRCIEIYEGNSDIIFVSTNDNLYRTTNNGANFTDITGSIPTTSNFSSIEVNPTNANEIWVTRAGWSSANHIFHTTDGGVTWNNITANLPNLPCNIIKHNLGSNGGVFVGTDIGVYYYDNTLLSWVQFMNNLPNVIVNDLEINESAGVIRAGTFGRGVWESPMAINLPDYDAGISLIIEPQSSICGSADIAPIVRLNNFGTLDLTSVDILYNIDGTTNQTFNWTGNIITGSFIDITLPIMTSSSGNHVFNVQTSNPNGQLDENLTNDANSSNFSLITNGGTTVTLNLDTDCWGSEITWETIDSSNVVILNGGPFSDDSNGELISESFCLADGCYAFIINDTYGDGLYGSQWGSCSIDGNYSITDINNTVLVQMDSADFGFQSSHNFCITNPLVSGFTTLNTTSCTNDSITFQDISTGAINSWNWTFNGGSPSTSTAQNPIVFYNNPGTYDVTLTVSDGVSTDTKLSSSYITIYETPTITISSTDEYCENNNGSASTIVSGGLNPYSFIWSNGASNSSISNLNFGNYSVIVVDNNNCSNEAFTTIADINGPDLTISNDETICQGSSTTISASSNSSNITYSWNQGLGNSSSYVVNPSITTTYTVTIIDGNLCTNSATTIITILPEPIVSISPTNPIICDGDQILLTASGAQTYSWNNGETTASILVNPNSNTTYSVTGNNGNCLSQPQTINVTVEQDANAIANVDINNPLNGETINFNSNGSIGSIYNWNFGDGNTSNNTTPSHSYLNTGIYNVLLEVINGNCTSLDSLEINVGLNGISSINFEDINIFPNPSNGNFIIELKGLRNSKGDLEILNNLGQAIYKLNTIQEINVIDLNTFSKGIYFIKISMEDYSFHKKIIIY